MEEVLYSVLEQAYPDLATLQDDYFIIGSAALALLGIKFEHLPDIDIVTSYRDAKYLNKKWREKLIKIQVKKSDLFNSDLTRYKFDGLDIEIMGNLKVKKNCTWEPLIVNEYQVFFANKLQVKIPTLSELERILRWFGRGKDIAKADFIREYQKINRQKD